MQTGAGAGMREYIILTLTATVPFLMIGAVHLVGCLISNDFKRATRW